MGVLQKLASSGADGVWVEVSLASNQVDGRVCYAIGRPLFSAARAMAGPSSGGGATSIPASLETRPRDPFEGAGGPLRLFFSSDVAVLDGPPTVQQAFDANAVRDIEFRMTGFDGTGLATSVHLQLPERKPIVLALQAQGDLFVGSGRSLIDGSPAGYVLAVTAIPA